MALNYHDSGTARNLLHDKIAFLRSSQSEFSLTPSAATTLVDVDLLTQTDRTHTTLCNHPKSRVIKHPIKLTNNPSEQIKPLEDKENRNWKGSCLHRSARHTGIPKTKGVPAMPTNTTQNNTVDKPPRSISRRSLRSVLKWSRSVNVYPLSPKMLALQKYFEEQSKAAKALRAQILQQNKKRTTTELRWAERQLQTFSSNNKLSSFTPGKSRFFRYFSDSTEGDEPMNHGDEGGKPAKEADDPVVQRFPSGYKVTPEAQEILLTLRDTVAAVIIDIITIDDELPERNFKPCFEIVEHLQTLPNMLVALIDHLQYTPQEFELVMVAKQINELIKEVIKDPVIILFKMIELGHYLYNIGRILGDKIVPKELPRLLHSVQVKLQRIKVGYVVRQYFHVPMSADFLLTPYQKDRQLLRLEEDCRCVITLLHPADARARYCPPSYRTIEVVYDEDGSGRFEAFQHRLDRILTQPTRRGHTSGAARLVSTVLRQFDGREVVVTAEHAAYLLKADHRPRYEDVRALVVSGSKPQTRIEKTLSVM